MVSEVFDPSSVFRIDHYLGKETCRTYWRYVSRTPCMSRSGTIITSTMCRLPRRGHRRGRSCGYYDGIGAARDIIQNHLLQLMALTAMEEPVSFSAADLTAEKTKVLSAVRLPKDLAAHTAADSMPPDGRVLMRLSAIWMRRALIRLQPQRLTQRSDWMSIRAVGPACRSTCVRANVWASVSRRLPWCSSVPASAVRVDRNEGARQECDRDPRAAR